MKSIAGNGATIIAGTMLFTMARGIATTTGTGATGTSTIAIITTGVAIRSASTMTNRGTLPGETPAAAMTMTDRDAGLLMFA